MPKSPVPSMGYMAACTDTQNIGLGISTVNIHYPCYIIIHSRIHSIVFDDVYVS
jgi:hypothetical protein